MSETSSRTGTAQRSIIEVTNRYGANSYHPLPVVAYSALDLNRGCLEDSPTGERGLLMHTPGGDARRHR